MNFKDIPLNEKETYLKDHRWYRTASYLFKDKAFSDVELTCIVCKQNFKAIDYKVQVNEHGEFIVCPNAPTCSGSMLHWNEV